MQFALKRVNGEPNIQPYAKKASTALTMGGLVYLDSNGFLDMAGATTAAPDIIGVCMETVAATDSDYASTRLVAVDVAEKGDNGDWFEAAAINTAAQTNVGESHDIDANFAVNISGTTYKVVKIQKFISATKVVVSLTGAPGTSVS